MMMVTVREVLYDGGTVAMGVGIDPEGREVRFAGDWRPMLDISNAITAGETPEVEVPEYAVLSVRPIEVTG